MLFRKKFVILWTICEDMNLLKRLWVHLSRLHHSLGFGIQSPSDYAFVRYVINEHWPYYAYQQLDAMTKDSMRRKLGKLYFRLANWRQPSQMQRDDYETFWLAGCRKTKMVDEVTHIELGRMTLCGNYRQQMPAIYNKVDSQSVLVIEGIFRDRDFWREIERDSRTGVTFDLYYCGIVFFDKKRHKKNYIINF